jgi:hypothetical protein
MKRPLVNLYESDSKIIRLMTFAENVLSINADIAEMAIFALPDRPLAIIDGLNEPVPEELADIMRKSESILVPPVEHVIPESDQSAEVRAEQAVLVTDSSFYSEQPRSSLTDEQRRCIEEKRRLAKERLELRRRSSEGGSYEAPPHSSSSVIQASVEVTATTENSAAAPYFPLPNTRPAVKQPCDHIGGSNLDCGGSSRDSIFEESQNLFTNGLAPASQGLSAPTQGLHSQLQHMQKTLDINFTTPDKQTSDTQWGEQQHQRQQHHPQQKSQGPNFAQFPQELKTQTAVYKWSTESNVPLTNEDLSCIADFRTDRIKNNLPSTCSSISNSRNGGKKPCIIYWPSIILRRSGNYALDLVEHLARDLNAPIVTLVCCFIDQSIN